MAEEKNNNSEEAEKPLTQYQSSDGSIAATVKISEDVAHKTIAAMIDEFGIDGVGAFNVEVITPWIRSEKVFFRDGKVFVKLTTPVGGKKDICVSWPDVEICKKFEIDPFGLSMGIETEHSSAAICSATGLEIENVEKMRNVDKSRALFLLKTFFV